MRFTIEEIDPSLLGDGLPDAFQRFTAEFFRDEIPGLSPYAAAGKDGGIDLRADDGVQTVVECKVVGREGLEHLLPRWRTTADALRRNLKDPIAPPPGQAQYRPWYDVTRPIRRYIVSTTGTFLNAAQEDEFKKELRQFFDEISTMPHLAHLRDIAVEVRDWTYLWTHTPPWLRLRWFRRSRPLHLLPLDSPLSGSGFREYLDRTRLPYYSRAEHLISDPAPEGVEIHDEDALLTRLEDTGVHGMLISGSGGVGKTRLSLELAWRALETGWTVLRASQRVKTDALTELARELTPRDRTLVLFDYVETQPAFSEIVAVLGDLNESYGLHLRYLANCRTSYAGTFQVLHRFHHIDLSPPPGNVLRDWLWRYRVRAVGRILSGRGLNAEAYHGACRDVPVLAVFLCWLADYGRQAEFATLLDEPDIGSWVLSSVRRSLPAPTETRATAGHPIDRDLALLMGMLPIPTSAFDTLPSERFAPLRDRLATDVWIERVAEWGDAPERWATVHDVLADQVLLAFAQTIPYTVPEFVRELLRTAATASAVEPAFAALQRVSGHGEFAQVRWADTVRLEMKRLPAAWHSVRTSLLRSSTPLAAPIPDTTSVNVRGDLALVEEPIRLWLKDHATDREAQFVYRNWLNGGGDLALVEEPLRRWFAEHAVEFTAQFVYRDWLDARGGLELVEEPIRHWLTVHGDESDAGYIYRSWLDAGGDLAVVEEPIRHWLAEHAVDSAATFVYRCWLAAQGDLAVVEEPIRHWLAEHAVDPAAAFVYRSWLNAGGNLSLVEEPIRHWLAEHGSEENAVLVYESWLNAGGE